MACVCVCVVCGVVRVDDYWGAADLSSVVFLVPLSMPLASLLVSDAALELRVHSFGLKNSKICGPNACRGGIS